MAQKTNLNVAPYYDDFESSDNFVRTLFRPGFAIQARELTQLQSALQNQIERHGQHVFKEGAMVIPGQISYNNAHFSLKLASTYAGETVNPSQYYSATTPVTITGATSGVTAIVIGYDVATTTDQPTLYLRYLATGSDYEEKSFRDGENISANYGVTHTTAYSSNAASATTYTSAYSAAGGATYAQLTGATGPAASTGSSVNIQAGVYYVRGQFVECSEETLVIDKYNNDPSYRVGFTITETLVAPEDDSSLLDNATGSTNYAAKGAHRLKFTLALAKIARDSTADSSFIELLDTKNGVLQSIVRASEYDILGDTLARRTFDESGDYTVRPFEVIMKESAPLNERPGVYTAGDKTDDGKTSSNALLVAQVSPGKAYVKGHELEKIAPTFKDVNKARDFETVNAGQTLVGVGNYVLINNVYGTPDISAISGENTAYKTITLYSDFISTRGSAPSTISSGRNVIGQCRARAIEYSSGTVGQTDAQYKLYIFDVKMFTFLELSGTPSPTLIANFANGGVQITGNTSGATGYVVNNVVTTTGTRLVLIKTSGIFQSGEKLIASDSAETSGIIENSSNTDLTVSTTAGSGADVTFIFDDVRSIYMEDTGQTSGQDFTADCILQPLRRRGREQNSLTLDGTDAGSANANSRSGSGETGDSNANTGGTFLEDILVPRLVDADKNNALEKLPKQVVKTLLTTNNSGVTDTQFTLRRQFIGTTNTSGVVAFNAGSNETFVALAEKDYVMSILTAGGGTGVQGQLVSIADTASGAGTVTLTITDNTILGSAAKVKLTATILKTSVTQKSKTTRLMKQLKVSTGTTDAYGTRPTDRDISFGRADAFALVGVFDSQDTSTDAVAPTLTTGTITGTFTRGERITGGTSNATGRIISTSSPMSYVSTNSKTFTSSEVITGESSGATATTSATTTGDAVITSRYLLDTGQRDNFYDIARIVRKKGVSSPIGKLLVIYDYLEHGAGDVFTVDSYQDIAKQMQYDDIPVYTASKIDTDEPKPSGTFPLYDCYDYRPTVDNVTGASAALADVDEITGLSFNFYSRTFGGTGGTTVDMPKPGSFLQSDFEYYLPKYAAMTLDTIGTFHVHEGDSAENPLMPKVPDSSMLIATMFIPAYTFDPTNVTIKREKHQRYTMKDIGRLEKRLDHVEYYTALSLLERDAESFEITDANGLNRFKSGFMVDNFKGHRVGDSAHRDYKNSMDFELGQLRPAHKAKIIELQENATTDAERTASGYQKTGDLITLPYSEVTISSQPYATRVERVTPFLNSQWVGTIALSPSSDTWYESEIAPQLIVNEEGDYDAVLARERNNLGSVWNSWQTQWSGVVATRTENWTEGGNQVRPDRFNVTRTTRTVRTDQTRTGVDTQVALRIDRRSEGFRVIARNAIPVVRSRTITFTGDNFRPNTRLWPYFDKTPISSYCQPASTAFTSDTTIVDGSPIITNAIGNIEGTFTIPDPKVSGNPQFSTGEVLFRLTSSEDNGVVSTDQRAGTAGDAIYYASGTLETEQETIIATRNATVTRRGLSQSTSFNTSNSSTNRQFAGNFNAEQAALAAARAAAAAAASAEAQRRSDELARQNAARATQWVSEGDHGRSFADFSAPTPQEGPGAEDPLSQTYKVAADATGVASGAFITSVDVYFESKDDTLPITLELRNTVNGYPGPKVLPFGRVVKLPADVNTSSTAATATTFTFPSPVYVESETEYTVTLLTNTPEYKTWICRMGEVDIGGSRTVSEQPHAGVLFKSSNNRAWSPSPMEDLKMDIKAAEFDNVIGNVVLVNKDVPTLTLGSDPIVMTESTTLKVKHNDHHMYTTSNNVTIAGVVSGASTTLNGSMTAAATTLTLTSGTNFDDTSGKYAKTASNLWYIKIDDEIMTYTTISTNAVSGLSRGVNSTTAATHADGATVYLYQAHKVPFTEINKTHTAIANMEIDSYTVSLTTTPVTDGSAGTDEFGGTAVTATENALMDQFSTLVGLMELPNTYISTIATLTSGTSPSGTQTSFTSGRNNTTSVPLISYPLNDNFKFDAPRMITSAINETNELSSLRSFETKLTLTTDSARISPVIDTERMSVITVANRLNNIDSSSDVYPTSDYVPSTNPEGDQNAAIYITKQVTLDSLATGLKVIFGAHRPASSEIKLMYKILGADESEDFDGLSYRYFNDDGSADTTLPPSTDISDFQEYQYTAGVTDDGIGTPLSEFISFQIKIIMQGTNCAEPPRLRSLRVLALGT